MDNEHQIINKKKELLCINMQKYNVCKYKNVCSYAHSLTEQYVTPVRKIIYDIIHRHTILDINLMYNEEILTNLVQMTNVCRRCQQRKCAGGYNCKFGVFDERYQICFDNLVISNCVDKHCRKYHIMMNHSEEFYDSSDTENDD
jgi:hypothetical protein